MMQYSVYIRHCPSHQKRDVHIRRVEKWVPADGEVRVFTLTDKQFEAMRVFWGTKRKAQPRAPAQLEFL